LPDSYTAFRNKIGLASRDGRYLARSGEVVLVWPYKDCILEGGQTRPGERRSEIFHNVILAPEEIDRLLEPKAFTEFRRFNEEGAVPLEGFRRDEEQNRRRGLPADTITDNLIIMGNNLLAMHSLLKEFRGKVKMIYIDPPYNTGNDEFQYNDRFRHSTWLTFMKNRLEVARELLSDDGAIFVQIDDNEQAYLKVMMDEIFGRENFRETIVVKSSTPSGVNAVNVKRGERLFKVKEYILFYSKNPKFRFKPIYVKSPFNRNYRYEVIKNDGKYTVKDLKKILKSDEELEKYALEHYENIYSLEKNNKKAGEKLKKVLRESRNSDEVIEFVNSRGNTVLVYRGGVLTPLRERIVKDSSGTHFGTLISDLWDDEIFQSNKTEGGVELPNAKKPEKLLKRIIELATEPGDIVMDFFMGTGTTCAVAHKMGRQYIGIEQIDYGKNSAVVRLQKVIHGEQTGISPDVGWKGGGDFVYMELMKLNQKYAERIQYAGDDELLKIWEEMKSNPFLSYRVRTETFEKNEEEFKELTAEEKKMILMDMLEHNELYVNFTEIEDEIYGVDEQTLRLNFEFYGVKRDE
jgi:adenine-specific DNA-methyltransferase